MKKILALSIALAFIIGAEAKPGCASPRIFATAPEVVTVTNNVIVVADGVTNVVAVPVFYTNTVYTVAPGVPAAVATVQQASGAIGAAYPPAVPIISAVDGAMGLGLAILAAIAAIKTRLAQKQTSALDKTTDMLTAVVSGVEVANSAPVKQAIAEHASVLGVTQALDTVVQSITANIPARKT